MFHRIGQFVVKRAWWVILAWIVAGVAIVATAPKLTAQSDASDFLPRHYESIRASVVQQHAFPANFTPSAMVLFERTDGAPLDEADKATMAKVVQGLTDKKVKFVEQVTPVTAQGTSKDGKYALSMVGMEKDAAYKPEAADSAKELRDEAKKLAEGSALKVQLGGQAAQNLDQKDSGELANMLIMLILGLLLRSVVAPWYLMAAVGLGFTATIGATSLMFQHVQGESGLMFMLPMLIYLFVVAIGTDYNILMIARLREEAAEGHSPREAASLAIRHGGPTVAAAGFILAATFGTMLLAGNIFFSEIGFSVAFGIIVSAFVMSLFFTPALTALLGKAAWWPGHAALPGHEAEHALDQQPEPAGRP